MSEAVSSTSTSRGLTPGRTATLATICALIAVAVLVALRYDLSQDRSFAGPSDLSFYFTLAKQIFRGGDLSINYVWHFLQPWPTVAHPANDYWQPLTAVLIAAGFWVTGTTSLQSALMVPGAAWLTIGVVVFVLARRLSSSVAESGWAAAFVLSTPFLLERSLLTDSAIFASLFGAVAIILAARVVDDLRWCPLAFAAVALTYLVRQDGILLCAGVAAAGLLNRSPWRQRATWFAIGVVAFIACCGPMWIINHQTIGTFMPAAPLRTAFLGRYEDLYAYDKALTLRSYLSGGFGPIVMSKLKMCIVEVFQLPQLLGWPLTVAAVLVVPVAVKRWPVRTVPWLFGIAAAVGAVQFVFYAFVATFPAGPGGFARAFGAIVPFIALAAVYALGAVIGRASHRCAVVAALVILNIAISVPVLQERFRTMDSRAREFGLAGEWLRHGQAPAETAPIVMTREPWEFSELTGLSSVQIPSDGVNAICRAAQHFRASVIVGPVTVRPELQSAVHRGDPRFSDWTPVPDTSLSVLRLGPGCSARPSPSG